MRLDGKQVKPGSLVDGTTAFNATPAGVTITVAAGVTMLFVQTLTCNGPIVVAATGRVVGIF